MTTLVTFKMDEDFLATVDSTARAGGYHNRTEFIREALRWKMVQIEKEQALRKLMGSPKRKTKDEDYERIRDQVFMEARGLRASGRSTHQ